MANPYYARNDYAFWKRTMSGRAAIEVDPVTSVPFKILRHDKVATAGSCFAQNISQTLIRSGFNYFVAEKTGLDGITTDDSYGVFSARFGNIYTVRQLLQLFQRAYGLFDPVTAAWKRKDGRYIDGFRPMVHANGFQTVDDLSLDQEHHLASVREMFESCDVFIFTLGLTEAWISELDGSVYPLAPGVVADEILQRKTKFHNFTVSETQADLSLFVDMLRSVNRSVRIVLTVSPVGLMATYEDRDVLVSTVYSKSVLRVTADEISRSKENVAYFPSYEIVTGPHGRDFFYEDDLREVRKEGVERVMQVFSSHFLSDHEVSHPVPVRAAAVSRPEELAAIKELERVICDEEMIDPS